MHFPTGLMQVPVRQYPDKGRLSMCLTYLLTVTRLLLRQPLFIRHLHLQEADA